MRELKRNTLILNEKSILDKLVVGEVDVPKYWYEQLLLIKLFQYFYDLGEEDIVGAICRVLELHDGKKTKKEKIVLRNYVEKEVKELLEKVSKGERVTTIYDLKESIKIYKSEVEKIKELKGVTVQRLAFSILVLAKIEMAKHDGQERYLDYYIGSYVSYADIKVNDRPKVFNELYKGRNN